MFASRAYLTIKFSAFLIFIGRAYQHLFWDAPYRSFFWDENLLRPIVETIFNTPWQEYATSLSTDSWIQYGIKINGFIYILSAVSVLLIKKINYKWLRIPVFIGGISLLLLAILVTKEKFYHTAQFFEHSIQFGVPFILLLSFTKNSDIRILINILKILIALTFFSHGLYAFGAYPVPGKFIDMVISIVGCSESTSILFLNIAGILDFLVAILIFLPKTQLYALGYAVLWGLLTAFARIVANYDVNFVWPSIHQNVYETLYRIPHGLAPLAVLFLSVYRKKRLPNKDSLLSNLKT